jgi:hypothetical protein
MINIKIILSITFFLFSFESFPESPSKWMPHGISMDYGGNIIYSIPFPERGSYSSSFNVSVNSNLGEKMGQVINLSKEENVFYSDIDEFENGIPANDGSGFKVINKYSGNLSFGPGLTKSLLSLWAGVNLTVSPGASYIVVRHIKKYKDIPRLPSLKRIPTSFKEIQKMNESDSISYTTSGSIAFNISTGKSIVHAGFTYLAEGSWVTTIKKVSPVHVMAQYKTAKLKGIQLSAGVSYTSVSLNKFKETSDALSYEFNLQSKEGLMAYQFFLKGDLTKARDIYLKAKVLSAFKKKKTQPVKIIKDIETLEVGKGYSGGVNIPYLIGANYKNQNNFIMQNTQQINKGTLGRNYIGVYKELSKTTGFLSSHSHRLLMFMGKWQTVTTLSPPGKKDIQNHRFSGNFKYEYHMNGMTYNDIMDELEYLSRRIGHRNRILSLLERFPESHNGFLQITADFMVSMEAIEGIMKWGKPGNLKQFETDVVNSVKSWFKDPENIGFNLCDWMSTTSCEKSYIEESKKALTLIKKGLKDMIKNKENSINKFVEGWTNVGKGFSRNQFTFNKMHKVLKKLGDTHLTIRWKGEKVPQGESVLFEGKTPYLGLFVGKDEHTQKIKKRTEELILKFQKILKKK